MTAHEDILKTEKTMDSAISEPELPPKTMPPAPVGPKPIPIDESTQSDSISRSQSNQTEQDSMTTTLSNFVSENPGPSLLIGAGLAWLFVNRERAKSEVLHKRLADKASTAREATSSTLSDARKQTGEKLVEARDYSSEKISNAKTKAQYHYESLRRDNPLALGAIALAGGLAIGLMLPSTRREDEVMGETRDSLMDQARRIVEEARDAAVAALRSGSEDVQEKLLEAKEEAQEAMSESVREAGEAAREEYENDDLN
jgi:ElaB/YqjD/DUF883 family membrane-anchored ribosome-binding protein